MGFHAGPGLYTNQHKMYIQGVGLPLLPVFEPIVTSSYFLTIRFVSGIPRLHYIRIQCHSHTNIYHRKACIINKKDAKQTGRFI